MFNINFISLQKKQKATLLLVSRILLGVFLCATLLSPSNALFAQSDGSGKLSITIAPPLFQVNIAQGTLWKSNLRVVNTNHYPLIVHANVSDFHPDGETGNAVFDTLTQGATDDTRRMSGWITVPENEIIIPPDQSYEIPFSIMVPVNADPGGHYAAIMVGTLPPEHIEGGGAGIGTTLTSLIFLRVPGEVIEEGSIRDFYAKRQFISTPEQSFVVRFENKGNVHLVPQGHIVITNMWGKERGRIIVNEKSSFGNVLPNSTRKFEFLWKGEASVFDIGRYKVEAVLSFGENNKQSAVRTISFWIIPWKPVSATLFAIAFFVLFFMWAVRRYIRKALELERMHLIGSPLGVAKDVSMNMPQAKPSANLPQNNNPRVTVALLKRPLAQGVADLSRSKSVVLQSGVKNDSPETYPSYTYIEWAKKYRFFLLFVALFIAGCIFTVWYFSEVFQDERSFQVTEIRPKG